MHDTDRTVSEFRPDYEGNEEEWLEFAPGIGYEEEGEEEESGELDELTYELMGVQSEEELDQFLGSLVKRATSAVKNFASSSTGKALGGFLKSAARKALPIAGKAVGGYFGGPAGAALGGKVGSFASTLFEGENFEEEMQNAKQFVKFAQTAAKTAAAQAQSGPPVQVAKQAVLQAARAHAPSLLSSSQGKLAAGSGTGPSSGAGMAGGRRQGRWMRRGTKIVLFGV